MSTREQGNQGEQSAWDYLSAQGYRLVEANYRAVQGEVDLIAWDGDVLCFIEVRTRKNAEAGHPLETINARKRQRIIRAARQYLADHATTADVRFDVVTIVYEPKMEMALIKGAYEARSAW